MDDIYARDDIFKILGSTVEIPEYYKWRSRSGCYFCFFQQKDEWIGLKENHPKLFVEAKKFGKNVAQKKYSWRETKIVEAGHGYTWFEDGTFEKFVEKATGKEKYIEKTNNNKIW